MQRLSGLLLLLVLGISCTRGHDEDLLGLPEYDIFGLDSDDTYYEGREREERSNLDPEELLKKLCYEYDLQIDSKLLNCQNIRIVPKTQLNEHVIQKREADETVLEGSGNYDQIVPANEQAQDNAETPNQESPSEGQETNQESEAPTAEVAALPVEQPLVEEQAPAEEQAPVEEQAPAAEQAPVEEQAPVDEQSAPQEEPAPSVPAEEQAPIEEQAPVAEQAPVEEQAPVDEQSATKEEAAPNVDAPTPSDTALEGQKTKEGEGTQFETPVLYGETTNGGNSEPETPSEAQETKEGEEPQFVKPVLYGEEATDGGNPETKVEDANSEVQSTEPPTNEHVSAVPAIEDVKAAPKLEEAPVQEAATTENSLEAKEAATVSVKKGRVLNPGGASSAKETEPSSTNVETDHEKLHDHQSANAVIDGSGAETLAGSDAAVKKMAAKENLKESELPKSGESSESTQASGKDSKILIILLVAVVVIGCAAFAYNFIKKRKQKKTEARIENGNSAQQKSAADKDAEQGTELKPLMKSNEEKPVVEYKDEKTVAA